MGQRLLRHGGSDRWVAPHWSGRQQSSSKTRRAADEMDASVSVSTAGSRAPLAYRPDIDGLRAIAVSIVIAFHAFPDFAPGGFVGVDVFFVISGYLISGLILKELEDGRFSFRSFYSRRIRRIFPALILVLASSLAFGWFALLPVEYLQLGEHVAAAAAFVINIVFIREAGYFDVAANLKPLLHLWSLSVEEQFYLVWPLLMYFSWRRGVRIGAFMTIALIVSFTINIDHVQWDSVGTFFGLPTRLWELAMGGILACAVRHPATEKVDALVNKSLFDPLRPVLTEANFKSALGVALIVVMTFTPIKQQLFPGWSAVYPTLGATLVIWAGPTAWINRSALGSRGFVAVGLISYPLYLWHWPLLSFARIVESTEPSATLKGIAILLAVILARLTYLLIERPIRSRHHGIAAPVLVAVLVLIGAAGFGVLAKSGLPSRVANIDNVGQFDWPQLFDLAPGRKDDANMDVSCKNELFASTEVNYCKRTWGDRPLDVALLGDSHANMYFQALSGLYRPQGKNLLNAGKGGCVPFFGLEGQAYEAREAPLKNVCAGIVNDTLDSVTKSDTIKTVILTSRDPFYRLPIEQNEKDLPSFEDPNSQSFMAKYARTMRDTLGRLQKAGKHVVFAFDIPILDFDPKACVKLRPLQLEGQELKSPCAIPLKRFEARTAFYRKIVGSVLKDFPDVKVFDPAKYLCDKSYCEAMKDGRMLYRDDNHVSLAGGEYLGPHFIDDALK
jgi:peptidoglycan/LPS O-acetylase OafA/YrhL